MWYLGVYYSPAHRWDPLTFHTQPRLFEPVLHDKIGRRRKGGEGRERETDREREGRGVV